MGKGDIGADTIITIGLLAGGAYLLATGQIKTVIERLKEGLDGIGGTVAERLPPIPTPGGGGGAVGGPSGPISSTAGCAGTPLTRDTGNNREEWESKNVPWDAYEVTWCGKIGSQGEDLTFKLYGPSHSGNACCWCVMHVDASGKMTPGGEGPHPSSNCEHGGGGSAGVAPCYKAVMRPGPIQEGYALLGGTWKKVAEYKGPCGCSKKSSTKTGNTLMVRCDGPITTKCASVRGLGAAEASYARAYRTYQIPHITNDATIDTGKSCTGRQGSVSVSLGLPKITIA